MYLDQPRARDRERKTSNGTEQLAKMPEPKLHWIALLRYIHIFAPAVFTTMLCLSPENANKAKLHYHACCHRYYACFHSLHA